MPDIKGFFLKAFSTIDKVSPFLGGIPGSGLVLGGVHLAEEMFAGLGKSGKTKVQFVDAVSVNAIVLYASARGVAINDPSLLSAKVKALSDATVDLEHYLGSLGIPGFGFLHSS